MRKHLRSIAPEAACFALVTVAYLVHFLLAGYDRFYFDAERYWRLGDAFGSDGGFSLLAYDDLYRGYSLPLLSHWLHAIASGIGTSDVTAVHVTGALLAATTGVVVIPRLACALFSDATRTWSRVLALNGLVFVFWRDHFGFPLTDFPALLAVAVGLLGLFRATPVGYVVAGLGLGLAANLRPAYLPAAIGVLLVAAFVPLRSRPWRRRGLAFASVLVGLAAVTLPQMAMNHRHHDTWSPTPVAAREIAMFQLTYGLLAQKYESYVGHLEEYPEPGVIYVDPVAAHVLSDEGVGRITSYGQYLRIVARHPELVASYGLHLFNGLDVRYPTPYVRDLRDNPRWLSLLQYTLLFAAIARLVMPDSRRRLGRVRWVGVVILVLPSLTAIAGAPEPRYFLPVQILVYMLVCFGPATRMLFLGGSAVRRLSLAAAYLSFLLLCLTLSAATQGQIEHGTEAAQAQRRSRISSEPARATTTKPMRRSSDRASGTARSVPISPV